MGGLLRHRKREGRRTRSVSAVRLRCGPLLPSTATTVSPAPHGTVHVFAGFGLAPEEAGVGMSPTVVQSL